MEVKLKIVMTFLLRHIHYMYKGHFRAHLLMLCSPWSLVILLSVIMIADDLLTR